MAVNGYTVIDETTLTTIGNAIRGKTGDTSLMTPAQMIIEIGKIGALKPFEWSWNYSIKNISVGTNYVTQYATYGETLYYLALGAETITMTNITDATNLLGWLDYLPDDGTAEIWVLAGILSDDQKTEIENKGYTIIEGT